MQNSSFDPDQDRDFRTFVPETVWNEYFSALGQFFHEYAKVENNLHIVLSNLLEETVFPSKHYRPKISDDDKLRFIHDAAAKLQVQTEARLAIQRRAAVRAVLGSMRLKSLKDSFTRLLRVTAAGAQIEGELARVFAQLGDIQVIRDRLAHNGATPDMTNKNNWFYTSDSQTQNLEEKISTVYFRASDLRDMTRDLKVIPDLLFDLFEPELAAEVAAEPLMQCQEMQAHLADIRGPFKFKLSNLRRESRRKRQRAEREA